MKFIIDVDLPIDDNLVYVCEEIEDAANDIIYKYYKSKDGSSPCAFLKFIK